ncbi:MAG: B12-binding domain-containing radical SAM protein [Gammaproteobacteria bacterium]|nr:B12-binding domain-containing radical SAM protein [Gammaproteobacteria bacterium]
MAHVALINPYTPDGNFVPPLGLLTLASVLEAGGHQVMIFDQNDNPDIYAEVVGFNPGVVGISAVTSALSSGQRIAQQLRETLPLARIVFGGAHPSAMPQQVLAWPEVDFVIVSEGEIPFRLLVDWIVAKGTVGQLAKIPNLHYKHAGLLLSTPTSDYLDEAALVALPRPAYHLLDVDRIASKVRHGIFSKGKRILPYMASRGCPYLCTFCSVMMGRKMRRLPVDRVLADLAYLVERYQVDQIYLEDDNFTASKKYANAILDGIHERALPITLKFANGIRLENMHEPMLEKMRRAGVQSLSFGLESGSEKVLKLMKKSLDLEKTRKRVEMIRRHGFLIGANMIIGYPGETEADIWESYHYFRELRLDSTAVVNLIPFPGTDVRAICEANGWLTKEADDWDNYYFDMNNPKVLIETQWLSQADVQRLLKQIFLRIYTDPRRVMTIVRNASMRDLISGAKMMASRMVSRAG